MWEGLAQTQRQDRVLHGAAKVANAITFRRRRMRSTSRPVTGVGPCMSSKAFCSVRRRPRGEAARASFRNRGSIAHALHFVKQSEPAVRSPGRPLRLAAPPTAVPPASIFAASDLNARVTSSPTRAFRWRKLQ